jgi:hypothetical protein
MGKMWGKRTVFTRPILEGQIMAINLQWWDKYKERNVHDIYVSERAVFVSATENNERRAFLPTGNELLRYRHEKLTNPPQMMREQAVKLQKSMPAPIAFQDIPEAGTLPPKGLLSKFSFLNPLSKQKAQPAAEAKKTASPSAKDDQKPPTPRSMGPGSSRS